MNGTSEFERRVRARLDSLTKPPGSLGKLEELAVRYALIRGEDMPACRRKSLYLFCGDHGVTAEGVSPYPSSVTVQMMHNFVRGGAAINVLCRQFSIEAAIVDVGCAGAAVPGVKNRKIAPGTANFTVGPAMTEGEARACLDAGREMAAEAAASSDLVALGEMGIGNTTTAAAVLCAFTGADAADVAGAGTGADESAMTRKIDAVRRGLRLHNPAPTDGLAVLQAFGGFEMGAIAGFLVEASRRRLPVVLDGFPCCAGAMIARALDPDALQTAFFAHRSAERGHARMLDALGAEPLFDLGMRLGEGSGAALATGMVESAVRLYGEMATFAEAGVAGRLGCLDGC